MCKHILGYSGNKPTAHEGKHKLTGVSNQLISEIVNV